MNKLFQIAVVAGLGLLVALVVAIPGKAVAEGTKPVFNAYDNVQLHYGVGSESDFLRLGTNGELGNSMEVCEDGSVVDLWFYIHNSTAAVANGGASLNGPGVADKTVVRLDVDQTAKAQSHTVSAVINAAEINPVSDGVTITCADQKIKLTYKKVSHFGHRAPALQGFGNFSLKNTDNIATTGSALGYSTDSRSGIVPGCWEYRARINIQLQVEVVEDTPEDLPEEDPEELPEDMPDFGITDGHTLPALLALGLLTAVSATYGHRAYSARRQ